MLLCICPSVSPAQYFPLAARAEAMGGAALCLYDVYAVFNNQASLAGLQKPQVATVYENRFVAKELNAFSLAGVLPLQKYGTFGLALQRSGFQLFNRNRIGIAYARKLGPKICVGMQFSYNLVHIAQGYGSAHVFSADAGMQVKIRPELVWALHISNPVRQTLAAYMKEKLPLLLRTGFMYVWSERLHCTLELEKDLALPFNVRFGTEYLWKQKIAFRCGFYTLPLSPALGFGYLHKALQIDMAASYKRYPGLSMQASLSWTFNRKL